MAKLKELLLALEEKKVYGETEIEILGVAVDSRKVKTGSIFIAIKGLKENGISYTEEAIAKGAVAIVSDHPINVPVTNIVVPETRIAAAQLANAFYCRPSQELKLIGITGTNGKTTISYLAEAVLNQAGKPTGVIGTIGYRVGGKVLPAAITTPDACQLQELLRNLVNQGISTAVLEVSSHALALHRVDGCQFHTIVFTNLSRDHLDFHKTPEAYFQAKERLFKDFSAEVTIINVDDPIAGNLIKLARGELITYGIEKEADLKATDIKLRLQGTSFRMRSKRGALDINLKLIGKHNVYNALAAAGIGLTQGIDLPTIKEGLGRVPGIPGRGELIEEGQDFTVIVDYAHTPDALEKILTSLVCLQPVRIITVFGCGGDRDRTKRPQMGEISTHLSTHTFITSDNPRSEDPLTIALDIEVGIKRAGRSNYEVVLDRREAIKKALTLARSGDLVLIAGKGHENYQIFRDQKVHFDDREVTRQLLRGRAQSNAASNNC